MTEEELRALYPILPTEQYDELVRQGIVRRHIKLKKIRTRYLNPDNGAILYFNRWSGRLEMCAYFIDPEHPKEIERQAKKK